MIFSQLAVPIEEPLNTNKERTEEEDFTFDQNDRFRDFYIHSKSERDFVSRDDQGYWYLFTSFTCETLDKLKLSRQIFRPTYLKDDVLPLVDRLNELQMQPLREGFDKAYGHALYVVENLDDVSPVKQLRFANYDGSDDPLIVKNLHFIPNEYKGKRTRFVTGFETRSFATITENNYYAENIHIPINACNYLKLFIYFSKYRHLPSKQMMPRFLSNLWASTESLSGLVNPSLFEKERIE
ncbi:MULTISPECIES: hypothetical protein [unclassified Bacillus (in: firmicutes)]|uniref:hypothetical protein n=1 Tax=unclassified Bacillus (in: firmicutes) TaxID=185979 RepID=UPI0008EED0DD|nr:MULTISPECIES: hypothetical protein [unclassified Bacillus (in: firmicutes)]SFA81372.1 hypothetical protein SAMN02799634_1011026 [Bacillus sp. UNCCL13]SFQ71465.1 hypothetical protein SAMN04488577_1299 [Bacillus sp. cl95]